MNHGGRGRLKIRFLDSLLVIAIIATAFALACQQLFDVDFWWHLRSGQWILANRRVPKLDPFTFASADRPWIDLHWLFQVILAGAYHLGGVRGTIVLTATLCAATLLIVLTSKQPGWPTWVMAACWLPALLAMSARFDPRPEILSLLYLAVYLAVLIRTDHRPMLVWVLPVVQVLWVNSHGLFILGPVILCAYLVGRLIRASPQSVRGRTGRDRGGRHFWVHVLTASAVVGLACLANPYGLKGALFPLELFPKITAAGGAYKANIAEFMSLQTFVRRQTIGRAAANPYFLAEYFLLLFLPLSFLPPAVWETWAAAPRARTEVPARAWPWLAGLAVAVVLAATGTLGLPNEGCPGWLVGLGRGVPAGFAVSGALAALVLGWQSRKAALLVGCGAFALAGWIVWLRNDLLGPEPFATAWVGEAWSPAWAWTVGVAAVVSAVMTIRAGGCAFRMILGVAFSYLALQAVRNVNLFGLVAGFTIASNLGEWVAVLVAEPVMDRLLRIAGVVARVALLLLIGAWLYGVASDRFYGATGELRHVGLREMPLTYAHEAARFAGLPGMPDRALVFDLRQTGVYLFHNGPGRKLFMDARLEVPTAATFETYMGLDKMLNGGRPGWSGIVRQMGDPLILLDHAEDLGAEATLLTDRRWRCVYYDPVASVFLPSHRFDLRAKYPTVDFASRHFFPDASGPFAGRPQREASVAYAEAKALLELGSALRGREGSPWHHRIPVTLLACDRARQAVAVLPSMASGWLILGHAYWNLSPDLSKPPPGPADPWDPATGLPLAQATYAYRRALELAPAHRLALLSLHEGFQKRRMLDAATEVAARLRKTSPEGDRRKRAARRQSADPDGEIPWAWRDLAELSEAIEGPLRRGRPESVARWFREAESRRIALPWAVADRIATTFMHLGDPATARRVWSTAVEPPSDALRLTRLAEADMAGMNTEAAATGFHAALAKDPRLGEAWFGLALLETQRGQATQASGACRAGLACSLTEPQRAVLMGVESMLVWWIPLEESRPVAGREGVMLRHD